jgi:hypothetical protein
MLKDVHLLNTPDPYYSGKSGFIGCSIESLHNDMCKLELLDNVPKNVRKCHDAVRHAYIYSYFSYDLLTLAASQTFPCLELALRERIGDQFSARTNKRGKPNPPMLDELLKTAKAQHLILSDIENISVLRNTFAHGSDIILNPPMFLPLLLIVTQIIKELFEPSLK